MKRILSILSVVTLTFSLLVASMQLSALAAEPFPVSPTMQALPQGQHRVGWYGNDVSLDGETVVAGANTELAVSYFVEDLYSMAGVKWISFDIDVNDVNIFKYSSDCQLRFFAKQNGSVDVEGSAAGICLSADTLRSLRLSNGVNHVVVPLDILGNYESSTKGADLEGFKLFSTGLEANSDRVVKLSNIVFNDEMPSDFSLNFPALMQALPEGSHRIGWYGTDVTVEDSTACAEAKTGLNLSYYEQDLCNLYGAEFISLDLYVSDVNVFKDGSDCRIRFFAKADAGIQEDATGFCVSADQLKGLELIAGWNHLNLPLTHLANYDSSTKGAHCEGFNLFSTELSENADREVKMKNIVFSNKDLSENDDPSGDDDNPGAFDFTPKYEPYATHHTGWYGSAISVITESVNDIDVPVILYKKANNPADYENTHVKFGYQEDALMDLTGAERVSFDIWTNDTSILGCPDPLLRFYAKQNGTVDNSGSAAGFGLVANQLKTIQLKDSQWVHVDLPLTFFDNFEESTKGADIEGFRLVFENNEASDTREVKLANLHIYAEPEDPDAQDDDATLSSLRIAGATLTPSFDPSVTAYTAEVSVPLAKVTAVTNNRHASVTSPRVFNLDIGENTIAVTTKSKDGTATKTYTVTINRKASDFLQWDSCDALESFFGIGGSDILTLDEESFVEGTGSISFEQTGAVMIVYTDVNKAVDATGYNAFVFDLYVPDVNAFKNGNDHRIQLGSGGMCDTEDMTWDPATLDLKEGWNHIVLPFSQAVISTDWKGDPSVDMTSLNYLRIFSVGGALQDAAETNTWRIDNIGFSKAEDTGNTGDQGNSGGQGNSDNQGDSGDHNDPNSDANIDNKNDNGDTNTPGTGASLPTSLLVLTTLAGALAVLTKRHKSI